MFVILTVRLVLRRRWCSYIKSHSRQHKWQLVSNLVMQFYDCNSVFWNVLKYRDFLSALDNILQSSTTHLYIFCQNDLVLSAHLFLTYIEYALKKDKVINTCEIKRQHSAEFISTYQQYESIWSLLHSHVTDRPTHRTDNPTSPPKHQEMFIL